MSREWIVDEDTLRDLASSACQEALSFGVNEDVFMRLARTVELRARAAAPQNDESQNVARIEWDGEGLPPAGVAFEFTSNDGHSWSVSTILYRDDSVILLNGYQLFKLSDPDIGFRPIFADKLFAVDTRQQDGAASVVVELPKRFEIMEEIEGDTMRVLHSLSAKTWNSCLEDCAKAIIAAGGTVKE